MNIQPINQQSPQTNFKAAYPVRYWIYDGVKYFPITSDMKLIEKLQSKVVRILNKPFNSTKVTNLEQALRRDTSFHDIDYRNSVNKEKVRSFYNRTNGDVKNGTWPSFIISGKNVAEFNEKFGKPIGRSKGDDKELFGNVRSLNTDAAVDFYNRRGYEYVTSRIISHNGEPYGLGVIFEPARKRNGDYKTDSNGNKIYNFLKAKFMPEAQLRRL